MSETYNNISATVQSFLASYQAAFVTKNATGLSVTLTPECTRTMQPQTFAEDSRIPAQSYDGRRV